MVVKLIDQALDAGESCLLFTGDIIDYEIGDDMQAVYRLPRIYKNFRQRGFVILNGLSKSTIPEIYQASQLEQDALDKVRQQLREVGLDPLEKQINLNSAKELRPAIAKLKQLLLKPPSQGQPMALGFDYVEHLTGSPQAGLELPEQIVLLEFMHSISVSPALQRSGNLVFGFLYNGSIPQKLADFYEISVPYPTPIEAERFIQFCQNDDRYANLEAEYTSRQLSRFVRDLPLKRIGRMFRHAKHAPDGLSQALVSRQKAEAVLKESEGTLTFEPAGDLKTLDDLVGLENLKAFFQPVIVSLREAGVAATPVVLIGMPGVGKTACVVCVANEAGLQTYKVHQTKDPLVGRSEEKMRKCVEMIERAAPVCLIIDEFDKAMPNPQGVADGGVSSDALAVWQGFLARDDLTKKGIQIVGTSNIASAIPTALQSRVTFLGVFPPAPKHLPTLIMQFIDRHGARLAKPDNDILFEAGQILYEQGCGPREIKTCVVRAKLRYGAELTSDIFLAMANDFCGRIDPFGIQLCLYETVLMTSFKSDFPWAHDPTYPLPECLREIVDVKNNEINYKLLEQRRQEAQLHARL